MSWCATLHCVNKDIPSKRRRRRRSHLLLLLLLLLTDRSPGLNSRENLVLFFLCFLFRFLMDSGMLFLRLVPRPPLCDEAVELADDVRELRRNHRAQEERRFRTAEPRFSPARHDDQRLAKTKDKMSTRNLTGE